MRALSRVPRFLVGLGEDFADPVCFGDQIAPVVGDQEIDFDRGR